jgi:hypothetical protein
MTRPSFLTRLTAHLLVVLAACALVPLLAVLAGWLAQAVHS